MCNCNNVTEVVSIIYLIVCFLIPLIYLICFYNYKSKHKNYLKAYIIAIIMFALLFSVKLIVKLDVGIFECANAYLNNNCIIENDGDKNIDKDNDRTTITTKKTTTTTSTSTTTGTTKKITTTTSKVIDKEEKDYPKLALPTGQRVNKGKTNKGYSIVEINGSTYIDGYLVANKTYFIPESFVPENTYTKADGNATKQCSTCIDNIAYSAWKEMKADAKAIGLNIYISSGFRSFITQRNIYNRNVLNNGQAKADTYSARPGSSEHQTGLAFDLNTITSSFANTSEGKWVANNAHKYGYIIRYPKGKTDKTGYIYEPWHLRYVGSDLAKKLYNNGNWLSMEEYFGITSKYSD